MAVALVVAAGQGEAPWVRGTQGARSRWAVGRCGSGARPALRATPTIEQIVLALPPGVAAVPGVVCVTGGAVRSESVRNALAAVAADADPILVHDAARPLLTARARRGGARRAGRCRRGDRGRAGDRYDEGVRRGAARRAHARPLASLGRADTAGVSPCRAGASAFAPVRGGRERDRRGPRSWSATAGACASSRPRARI